MPRQDGAGLTLPDLLAVCQAIGFQLEELPDRVRVLGYRLLS
jgi:hypothetical protein